MDEPSNPSLSASSGFCRTGMSPSAKNAWHNRFTHRKALLKSVHFPVFLSNRPLAPLSGDLSGTIVAYVWVEHDFFRNRPFYSGIAV